MRPDGKRGPLTFVALAIGEIAHFGEVDFEAYVLEGGDHPCRGKGVVIEFVAEHGVGEAFAGWFGGASAADHEATAGTEPAVHFANDCGVVTAWKMEERIPADDGVEGFGEIEFLEERVHPAVRGELFPGEGEHGFGAVDAENMHAARCDVCGDGSAGAAAEIKDGIARREGSEEPGEVFDFLGLKRGANGVELGGDVIVGRRRGHEGASESEES